jgi:hypothetical protein
LDNIRIIETGIDVSKIKEQLELYSEDWGIQTDMAHADMLDPTTNLVSAKVLQLIVGAVTDATQNMPVILRFVYQLLRVVAILKY